MGNVLNSKCPQSGYDAMTNVTSTESVKTFIFKQPFSHVPNVVISFYGASYNRRIHIQEITKANFTWRGALLETGSAAIEILWIAV